MIKFSTSLVENNSMCSKKRAMGIIVQLNRLIDDIRIQAQSESALPAWAPAVENTEKDILTSSAYKFISHKLCFKSSSCNCPFIETSIGIINSGKEVGLYRLIKLLDGAEEDDYSKIH